MTEVEFIYNEGIINLHCKKNDKMKDICDKFKNKSQIDKNSIYYLYNGDKINEELTFEKLVNNDNINKISILVNLIDDEINRNNIIKSKNIICPECKENIRIKIEDYKIKLYGCKKNHIIDNILLEEFENTQEIDISKIKCEICKVNNKADSHKNIFYRCNKCKINICPLCKLKHDKDHNIINFELKDFLCNEHNEVFVEYCNECKKDICLSCENKHNNHETIFYKNIIRDLDEVRTDINEYKKEIDKFNNNIDEIINKLKKVKENMKIYYNIYHNMINNYEVKNRSYNILNNLNEINNNIIKDIKKINNINNMNDKINNIINIYNKMNFINDINIIYNIKNKGEKVKLFGEGFVKNNKDICKILIENKEYELMEEYNIKNYNEKELKIKLIGINNITNMNEIFNGCSSLSSLPDISKWNTNNVTNMICIFNRCSSLSSLPDISKWNTNNVTNMYGMFSWCSSLLSLPDISKWNTNNVTNMSCMFSWCSSLSSLPDISKWSTNNVTDMSGMFCGCSSLSSLPDISKWNTNNVINMSCIFNRCSSDLKIPSKFNK